MLEYKSEIMSLTSDCLAQLKLRQAPFEALPDETFLYTDPLLESLVETAIRALAAAGAIVILAGANGSGRSVQLMRLLGGLGEQFEIIAFRGRADIPFAAVEATIRNHFQMLGLNQSERTLRELLTERGRSGVALVLAVDDAHLLGGESIDRLLRLRSEVLETNGQGLRLVLVGDTTLNRNRLPLPDLADANQVVRLNLRPFNLEQAGAYLRHRLRVAGADDSTTFLTSGDIATLQSSGKGIPAALNAQANAWLLRRCRSAQGARQSIVGKISHLMMPTTAAAAAPAEPPLTPSRLATTDTAPVSKPPPAAPAPAAHSAPPPAPELLTPLQPAPAPASANLTGMLDLEERVTLSQPAAQNPELSRFLVQEEKLSELSDFDRVLSQIRNSQLPPLTTSSAPKTAPKPSFTTATQMMNRSWFIPAVLGVVIVMIVVPVVWQLNSAKPTAPTPVAPVTPVPPRLPPRLIDAASPQPMPLNADDNSTSVASNSSPLPAVTPKEPPHPFGTLGTEEPPSPPVEPPPPPPSAAPISIDLAADLNWLKRQDAGRFTVQLIAARTPAIATDFIQTHQVEGFHVIKTRSFMVVIVGSYPNRAAAENAIRALPAAVRAGGPWVRTIGSVLDSQR
ncbi:hypothetical protein CKO09_01530 [Chromatium weissei]|nr:hypothetical protein [Chromatium weissei]